MRKGRPVWGLEYALLFGAPENKLELLDGQTPLSFPFPNRAMAESHFADWTRTLGCLLGRDPPTADRTTEPWTVKICDFLVELHRRPIYLRIPFQGEAFIEIYRSFWRRDLWDDQPPGYESGWEPSFDHSDIAMNLYRLFDEIQGVTRQTSVKHSATNTRGS
jgi:hypothetical protein